MTWVYRDLFKESASTIMRGRQLSELAKTRLANIEVGCVDESHLAALSQSVLILTKGFLKETSLDELARLKERGNIICADYVDDRPRNELHPCVDVYVAASIKQFLDHAQRYADRLVHLITHHTDPRVNGTKGPEDHCRVGYFGELANARYIPELRDIVDFCLTPRTWPPPTGFYR